MAQRVKADSSAMDFRIHPRNRRREGLRTFYQPPKFYSYYTTRALIQLLYNYCSVALDHNSGDSRYCGIRYWHR
jgi:hypothetical protein